MLKSVCSAISVAAFAYLHPWRTASTIEVYQLGFLIAALGCDLSNVLVFSPMSLKMLMKKYKLEKDLGIGTEVGYSKSTELAKTSPVLAAMNRKFWQPGHTLLVPRQQARFVRLQQRSSPCPESCYCWLVTTTMNSQEFYSSRSEPKRQAWSHCEFDKALNRQHLRCSHGLVWTA